MTAVALMMPDDVARDLSAMSNDELMGRCSPKWS
jgi:hypothetical protein